MNLWQHLAAKQLEEIFSQCPDVNSIEFKGSILDETLLDIYSDVDISIYLKEKYTIDFLNNFKNNIKAHRRNICL